MYHRVNSSDLKVGDVFFDLPPTDTRTVKFKTVEVTDDFIRAVPLNDPGEYVLNTKGQAEFNNEDSEFDFWYVEDYRSELVTNEVFLN